MIFDKTDEQIKELGFSKIIDRDDQIEWVKGISPTAMQKVVIRKKRGEFILESFDPELMDYKGTGFVARGLKANELKLFLRKMTQMNKKSEANNE